jgi:D-alanine-D-alanine ligase
MKKKLRILTLVHEDLVPPDDVEGIDTTDQPWRTEFDVIATLSNMGHEVRPLGVRSDLRVVRDAIDEWKPDIAFNLLEEFDGEALYDQNVVSYLELLRMPYTGCNPRGIMLSRDKALSKKILAYHRIPVPDFAVFPMGGRAARPRRLAFPLIVKSLVEEASLGISQASVVYNDEGLQDRIRFIHEKIGTDAIAEQYIEGRELYVGVVGDHRLAVLPIWELLFTRMPEEKVKIATAKVKWDHDYQKRHGITSSQARNLPEGAEERIRRLAKRVYRNLMLTGYARLDLRLTEDGRMFVLEANPNPQLAYGEDFAESAHCGGMPYQALLQRIVNLGLRRRARLGISADNG